jgi:hypothetical protein
MYDDNRRNYFRVDMLIPVRWKLLDNAEIDLVKNGLGITLLSQSRFKSPMEEIKEDTPIGTDDDHIHHSLQLLNNKLDLIINMLLSQSEATSAKDSILDMSASGLKFKTAEHIDSGVYLKMNLIIPGTPPFHMDLIAETLRNEKAETGYVIASKIICIDDDARDFIIKMIFQRERVEIRRLKTSQEAGYSD